MENTKDKELSFPQRNWLLLCIIVAILSPLVVHWVHTGARERAYGQATDTRNDTTGKQGASASGGSDTSYKVAAPPSNGAGAAGANGAAGGDSASKGGAGH